MLDYDTQFVFTLRIQENAIFSSESVPVYFVSRREYLDTQIKKVTQVLMIHTTKQTKACLERSYLNNVHDDTGRHHPQTAQQVRQQDLSRDDVRALRQKAMRRACEFAGESSELLSLITELQF